MSYRTTISFAMIGVLLMAAGCGPRATRKPLIEGRLPGLVAHELGVRVGQADLERIELLFDVQVSNPYNVPLRVADGSYILKHNDIPIAGGEAAGPLTIPARKVGIVTIPVTLSYAELTNALPKLRPGTLLPIDARLDVMVYMPGKRHRPMVLMMRQHAEVPIPHSPLASLRAVRWSELQARQGTGTLEVRVSNPNRFPIDLASVEFVLHLNGRALGMVRTPATLALPAVSERVVPVPLSIVPCELGEEVYLMLRQPELEYELEGTVIGRTPAGPIALPFKARGKTILTSPGVPGLDPGPQAPNLLAPPQDEPSLPHAGPQPPRA